MTLKPPSSPYNPNPSTDLPAGTAPALPSARLQVARRWVWDLKAAPEALWPLISDTERFNRDADVPSVRIQDAGDVVNARRHLKMYRLKFGPLKLIPLEWEEEPFEWVRPRYFGVVRYYTRGPLREMRVRAELERTPQNGTRLVYQTWMYPRNIFMAVLAAAQLVLSYIEFGRTFRHYDRLVVKQAPIQLELSRPHLVPGGSVRLENAAKGLIARGAEADSVGLLVQLIQRGEPMTLASMRPYVLADLWGKPRRPILELFLLATRAGILDLRWELLCPLCRGAKEQRDSLNDLPDSVHCEVCHIDFGVNFEQSVELTFRPNASVRVIDEDPYCVAGPQTTPHILLQQLLQPGESTAVDVTLDAGRYRVRALSKRGGQYVQVQPDGTATALISAPRDQWTAGEITLAPSAQITLENLTDGEELLLLEHLRWSDQAVVAAEVTTLQMFRDLFSREALRPNSRIEVGSLTLVFTDLRGSSRLYREIGDAPAFGVVMDHFDVLRDIIADEEGAIVKTLGDAVMAVFRRPVNAVSAILRAQRQLAEPGDGRMALYLKAGIHTGSTIAVNLNDHLDYFGTTVNLAARLADLCQGTDIVVSAVVAEDPEVKTLFAERDLSLNVSAFQTDIRGFDQSQFQLYRVSQTTPLLPATPQHS